MLLLLLGTALFLLSTRHTPTRTMDDNGMHAIISVCRAFSGSDPRYHRSVPRDQSSRQSDSIFLKSASSSLHRIADARGPTSTVLSARRPRRTRKNDDDDDNGNGHGNGNGTGKGPLPALGPAGSYTAMDPPSGAGLFRNNAASAAGESSHGHGHSHSHPAANNNDDNNNNNNNTVATFVNPKFSLQYTCKICETKNRVLVSRQAYREGMVVAVCKGCDSKHWIADNLDPTLHQTPNIEAYLESKGLGDTLNRVSPEVYEIERVWGLKEGVLTDDSGKAVLE